MVEESVLRSQATDLCSQARSLEITKVVEEEQAGIWARELQKRRAHPSPMYDDIQEARINRDWHMQLADDKRKQIKHLVKKAERLLGRVKRIEKRRK